MRRLPNLAWLVAAGSSLAIAGCAGAPPPPSYGGLPSAIQTAQVLPAYLHADVIGGRAARVKKARAAGIRPLAASAVAEQVATLDGELRRQIAGTGVEAIRAGNMLFVRFPSATFVSGSSSLTPQAASVIREVGLTLKNHRQSLVDVLGHTDSTGAAATNQRLSEQRAAAVAAALRSSGVAAARIATKGYAAQYPIADNATEAGRALNRRVEIKVVPLQ